MHGIAVDSAGSAYLHGGTASLDFLPHRAHTTRSSRTRSSTRPRTSSASSIRPAARSSTRHSSARVHNGEIAVDAQGDAYVTGRDLLPDLSDHARARVDSVGEGSREAICQQAERNRHRARVLDIPRRGRRTILQSTIAVDPAGHAYARDARLSLTRAKRDIPLLPAPGTRPLCRYCIRRLRHEVEPDRHGRLHVFHLSRRNE